MADIRINALPTTASASSSDDYIALDGTTNGTRKLNAYSPTFGGNLTVSGTGTSTFGGILNTGGSFASPTSANTSIGINTTAANWEIGRNASTGGFYIYGYGGAGYALKLADATGNATLSGNLTVSGNGLNTFGGTGATNASILFGANNVANASAGYLSISQRLNYGFALFGYNMTGTSGSDAYTSPKNATGSAGVELIGGSLGITRFIYSTAATTAGNALTVTEAARFSTGNLLLGTTTDGGQKLQVAGTAEIQSTLTVKGAEAGPTTGISSIIQNTTSANDRVAALRLVNASNQWNLRAVGSGDTFSIGPGLSGSETNYFTLSSAGNATFAGTISQTQAAAGSTPNLTLTENGVRAWSFYATGGKMSIRPSSVGTWSFNGNTDVELVRTTASTTTGTGALQVSGGVGVAGAVNVGTYYGMVDGVTAPGATSGYAKIYVDTADGDLKVIFGDGTIKTIATDT